MKKIIFLLIIFFVIVFFTKFYDTTDTIKFGKIFENLRYNVENFVGNNEISNKWNNNGEITNGENSNNNEEKNDGNNIINNDFIKYENSNIIYIDENGKIFTGIGTITLNYNSNNITMLDRNLGATTNNTYSKDSYGYYFQRGNNYGFSLNTGNINTKKGQIDITGYGPSEYSSSYFIIPEYGERILDHYIIGNNLWGGGLDSQENERGLTSNNDIKLRQGPCPEGYHIPSIGERNQLIGLWIDYYTGSRDTKCVFLEDDFGFNRISNQCKNEKLITKLYEIFKIPQAGKLIYWNLYNNEQGINLRSSTFRYKFESDTGSIRPNLESQYANAMPIRCFSNNNAYIN